MFVLLSALVATVLLAALPDVAGAQGHELQVTLHDPAGQPLSSVEVLIRSEAGEELARATTSADGAAAFAGLPAVVRVAVRGQPRRGPALFQLGTDEQGVRIHLAHGDGATVLNLRAERDGLVLPDPATEVAPDQGGPDLDTVTPLPAATQPFQSAGAAFPPPIDDGEPTPDADGTSQPAVMESGAPPAAEPGTHTGERRVWLLVLLLAFAAGAVCLTYRLRNVR
jgi:hypothetical protein